MYISEPDLPVEVLKHAPVLEELHQEPLRREALERRVGISSTTGYRYTGWLAERDLIEETDKVFALTVLGEALTEDVSRLEATVRSVLRPDRSDREDLLKVVRLASALTAFREKPRDRRDLEERLGVSKSTSFRFIRSLAEVDLLERASGTYALTARGAMIAEAVETFETNVRTAVRLGPVLETVRDVTPSIDVDAFADATVRTPEQGDAHSPVNRFISLVEGTTSLRCIDSNSIVPLYISDIQRRIIDGLEAEDILTPSVVANVLAEHPGKCIEACRSGHLTVHLHEELPYGLAIFDDRVGIGVRNEETRTLQMFVDTDSPTVREWAEAVFESYRSEAVRMERFGPRGFKSAIESGQFDSVDDTEIPARPPSTRSDGG
ncbi:MAG: ArsR family transcriptional regulator [Thermoanaerobaculia bacterium]|nr:ArsR family transcriptional regulator [Thermoanaerobaculia bacterium]